MPIIQVNHPENIVAVPLSKHPDMLIEQYLGRLWQEKAQFSVAPPGFVGDITPNCFRDNPAIPPVSEWLEVDETGEAGILTRSMPPGSDAVMLSVVTVAGSKPKTKDQRDFRIPEDGENLLIAHATARVATAFYVGGLVMLVSESRAARLDRLFRGNARWL